MYDFGLLETWNIATFNLLRGTAGTPPLLISTGALLATLPAYLAGALVLWRLLRTKDAAGAVILVIACAASRLAEALISVHASHARPFAAGFGPPLIEHAANNSMPSSHATFVWILAAVCLLRKAWGPAVITFLLGCVLAWARIFVGIHWPLDMAGALLVASACALCGFAIQRLAAALLCRRRRPGLRAPPASALAPALATAAPPDPREPAP